MPRTGQQGDEVKRYQMQPTTHSSPGPMSRRGLSLPELLVVIAIIAILAVISTSAYIAVTRRAQEHAASAIVQTLADATDAYYNENHDYPPMRLADLGLTPSVAFPTVDGLPNADQSVATLIYCLQYRSSAGDLLKNLPAKVLVPLTINGASCTVEDPPGSGEFRQMYTVRDPWGNPIQYIRPRSPASAQANYPLLPQNLNNRVLLISMGRDGQPGQASGRMARPGTIRMTGISIILTLSPSSRVMATTLLSRWAQPNR